MRVEKGKSTAEPSLATMSLDKQQTNKQCRAGRDVAGLDGKGAAEGAKGSQQNLFHITEFDSKTNVTNMLHTSQSPAHQTKMLHNRQSPTHKTKMLRTSTENLQV